MYFVCLFEFFLFLIIFYNRIVLQRLGEESCSFTIGSVRSSAPHALFLNIYPTALFPYFILYSLLFLKYARQALTSGTLNLFFLLSWMLFSQSSILSFPFQFIYVYIHSLFPPPPHSLFLSVLTRSPRTMRW